VRDAVLRHVVLGDGRVRVDRPVGLDRPRRRSDRGVAALHDDLLAELGAVGDRQPV
jgi:hypothetical protein